MAKGYAGTRYHRMTYRDFFARATTKPDGTSARPYPYQEAIAAASTWPEALSAPTGAGKTEAIGLAWLYKLGQPGTPTRLVFCLPQRVLVEQTVARFRGWVAALKLDIDIITLMGGASRDDDWGLYPEKPTIIVGTQDVLLSRALNRGYGISRYRWPIEAALLNNDTLWVFDEIQLAGVGLSTARQLEAARRSLGAYGTIASCYVSATLDASWLRTVDAPTPAHVVRLTEADVLHPMLRPRREASKPLVKGAAVVGSDTFSKTAAAAVIARHVAGTRTIAIMNTVRRASDLYDVIRAKAPAGVDVRLLHSRFRPDERKAIVADVTQDEWHGILVSTQVIEAGVDMSARTLWTELAPWASLVQRAGRCNRKGEYKGDEAAVVWWDHKDENVALPYMAADCAAARQHLLKMPGFSPAQIDAANVTFEMPSPSHMLRRRDIVELFDNSASIEGLDIDVGCYVRDSDDSDVSVFWRPELTANAAAPRREELCSVPVYVVRAWMNGVEPEAKKGKRTMPLVTLFRWNHVDGEWCRVVTDRAVVPGVSYMASCAAGGYVPDRGWAPKSTAAVPPVAPTTGPSKTEVVDGDANDGDALSFMERWVSLRDHATHARDEAEQIVARVPLPADMRDVCVRAAQAHDLGKAHPVFQETMNIRLAAGLSPMETWAKSGNLCRHKRRGFRHELASALAWLIVGPEDERDLIAYLLAAHHGKVRASLRALAKDAVPEDGRQHARGVWQGDEMPCADLGDGLEIPAVTLSLDVMPIGDDPVMGPSWVDRVSRLLARFGPFRLMYLEMVVRAADVRATRMERLPR